MDRKKLLANSTVFDSHDLCSIALYSSFDAHICSPFRLRLIFYSYFRWPVFPLSRISFIPYLRYTYISCFSLRSSWLSSRHDRVHPTSNITMICGELLASSVLSASFIFWPLTLLRPFALSIIFWVLNWNPTVVLSAKDLIIVKDGWNTELIGRHRSWWKTLIEINNI